MRIITKVQTLTIVPLKAVVKMLNAKLAISPATDKLTKKHCLSVAIVNTEIMTAKTNIIKHIFLSKAKKDKLP